MKHLIFAVLFLAIAITTHAQVYKWVDENGTTHYSDKPHSSKATEIDVPQNGVTYRGQLNRRQKDQARTITTTTITYTKKVQVPNQQKIITADDYEISPSVGKLGNDVMSVSGRVGNGPTCKDMRINAYARNENGLSAAVLIPTLFGLTFSDYLTPFASLSPYSDFWRTGATRVAPDVYDCVRLSGIRAGS